MTMRSFTPRTVTPSHMIAISISSVVTRDIPAWSFAAGNPARVIRRITEADRFRYGRGQTADPEAEAEMRRVWAEHPDDPAFPTAPEE